MKQNRIISLLLLLSLAAACKKEEPNIVIYRVDSHHISRFFERYNLPRAYVAGQLKSTEMIVCHGVADGTGAVTMGDTLEKVGAHFDRAGYITTDLTYTIPEDDSTFVLTLRVDFTYDDRHRIAGELSMTAGSPDVTYEKQVYTYDDKAGTATRVTSVSTDNEHFTKTGETVYRLGKNGFIDESLHEERPIESRVGDGDFTPLPTSSLTFVETREDERGAWTEGYFQHVFRDQNGTLIGSEVFEYFKRVNIYF
ncbi:MAG: hypothetical protein LBK12_01540 [Odoribacteraceae bacterium]|nr:hypothetical protein [Odoribacteraceae bacterium]